MKLYQRVIYLILLLLIAIKAIGVSYHQYESLGIRYLFGYHYDSKFDFYFERIQEGMFIEPLLLILMVVGLLIKNYSGWILTLLLPSVILIYTIAYLLGLVDFWGIIDIPNFIFYYVLLIALNISKIRQIFNVDSIKMALTGNLIAISISIIIGIMIVVSSNPKEVVRPSQIMGNWYFIDSVANDFFYPYHEMKIDSTAVQFFLGGLSQPGLLYYHIKWDTLYYYTDDGSSWPVMIFNKTKPDTLVVDIIESSAEPRRILTFVRLAKGRKYLPDYFESDCISDNDNSYEIMRKKYFSRYNEYRIKNGLPIEEY